MIIQLNPPIPMSTPKGNGLAWLVVDYGAEHHLMWTVAINETGEIWTLPNTEIRAEKNITMGRMINKKIGNNEDSLKKNLDDLDKHLADLIEDFGLLESRMQKLESHIMIKKIV